MEQIDWATVPVWEVEKMGTEVMEIQGMTGMYKVYRYKDRLVEIHVADRTIVMVLSDSAIEYAHPSIQNGLMMMLGGRIGPIQ